MTDEVNDPMIAEPHDGVQMEMPKHESERTCRSKGIAAGELPHSCHELGETAREAGHANDNIGGVDISCIYIVQRENECG